MPRPRQISDDDIAAAARACFLEHGPGVSVAAVAARLGVSAAALFHRVGTKEKLLQGAFAPRSAAVRARLEAGPAPDRPARAQLVEALEELLAELRELVPGLLVLRAAQGPIDAPFGAGGPPPLAHRRALAGWLARAAGGGLDVAAPPAIADALLGALEARCFNAHLGGPRFVEGTDRAYVRGLVDALVPAPPGRAAPGGRPR